jgi:hypothetical protein
MNTRSKTRGGGGGGGGGGGERAAGAGGSSGAVVAGVHGHPSLEPPAPEENDAAPSELLVPLLEQWPDVLVTHVLSRLDPTVGRCRLIRCNPC